jgi:uncharacterized protein with PQ loop repeat
MYVIIVNIIVKEGLGFWIVYGILKNPINIWLQTSSQKPIFL